MIIVGYKYNFFIKRMIFIPAMLYCAPVSVLFKIKDLYKIKKIKDVSKKKIRIQAEIRLFVRIICSCRGVNHARIQTSDLRGSYERRKSRRRHQAKNRSLCKYPRKRRGPVARWSVDRRDTKCEVLIETMAVPRRSGSNRKTGCVSVILIRKYNDRRLTKRADGVGGG